MENSPLLNSNECSGGHLSQIMGDQRAIRTETLMKTIKMAALITGFVEWAN
jgi:hypothetical protein